MCRVGTVLMTSPGCNHARQSGWQDSAVVEHLSHLITPCSSGKKSQKFCSKLSIDNGSSRHSSSSARRSGGGVPPPPSLASLMQPTSEMGHPAENSLDGKCKFCASYESEIRLADHIKQTLSDYNMALLFDEARLVIQAEMERAFQHAVDEAVKAYGIDGKGRDKALRTLDSEYQKASAEISRMCGERQLAPYRELYGR